MSQHPDDDRFGADLGAHLRHTTFDQPAPDLLAGSLNQAHRIRRRRAATGIAAAALVMGAAVGGVAAVSHLGASAPTAPPVAATPPQTATAPSQPSASTMDSAQPPTRSSSQPPTRSSSQLPSRFPSSKDPAPRQSPSSSRTAPPESRTSSAPTRTSPSASTSMAPPTSTSTAPPTSTATPSTATVKTCSAGTTSVAVKPEPGGGAAGSYYFDVVVTNTGSATCTVRGFPGVSMVQGDAGSQLGAPAARDGTVGSAIKVAPGKTAKAVLRLTQAGNYGPECRTQQARGFRIYLPDETDAQFAKISVTGCANATIKLLRIRTFGG